MRGGVRRAVREWGARGGGVWRDAGLCCGLQGAAPVRLSPRTPALPLTPLPPQAAAPIVPSLPLPDLS